MITSWIKQLGIHGILQNWIKNVNKNFILDFFSPSIGWTVTLMCSVWIQASFPWKQTLTSLFVCLFQFSQASAIRSYTKFVMGVSSTRRHTRVWGVTLVQHVCLSLMGCFSLDCSECSDIPIYAGGRCDGSQQLRVRLSFVLYTFFKL